MKTGNDTINQRKVVLGNSNVKTLSDVIKHLKSRWKVLVRGRACLSPQLVARFFLKDFESITIQAVSFKRAPDGMTWTLHADT